MTTQGELPDIVERLRNKSFASTWENRDEAADLIERLRATPAPDTQPRVTDDDKDSITVTFNGRELRGWSYASDAERHVKMTAAREYVEGWCDGRDAR